MSHDVRDKIKVPYQRNSNFSDRVNIVTGFYRRYRRYDSS